MLSKIDIRFDSKDDLFYSKTEGQDNLENLELNYVSDYNFNLTFTTSDFNLFLENNIFLEKKRLRAEKDLFEFDYEPEKFFDGINKIFLFKKDSFEERDKNSIYLYKKPPFKTKNFLRPGRKRKNQNEAQVNIKKHGKTSFDNITSKVQIHYITFIIHLTNDVIISIFGKNSEKDGLYFTDIDYKIKKNISFKNMEKLKTQSIKDILLNPSSTKFSSKNEDYNKKIYNKLVNSSEVLDELFNMNYMRLFRIYHNNAQKIEKIIIKQKEIKLSNKTKSFFELIESNNDEMKKLILEYTERVYFT
jgi:hypothetical protein